VLDVTNNADLIYEFTPTTSDFVECRDITMKQTTGNPPTVPLSWPGTPSTELTTTDAITNLVPNKAVYKVVNTHKPHVIKFFIIS